MIATISILPLVAWGLICVVVAIVLVVMAFRRKGGYQPRRHGPPNLPITPPPPPRTFKLEPGTEYHVADEEMLKFLPGEKVEDLVAPRVAELNRTLELLAEWSAGTKEQILELRHLYIEFLIMKDELGELVRAAKTEPPPE